MDEAFGRELVSIAIIQFPEDRTIQYVDTEIGRIDISPGIELKAQELYRLQLWDDGTISMWQLIADGVKGMLQCVA